MLRSPVLNHLVLIVLLMAGAVFAVTAISAREERAELARLALEQSRQRTDAELRRFFVPVERQLRMIRAWGVDGQLEVDEVAALNARLIPAIDAVPQVTSALIGNSRGEEVLLLEDGDTWRNRRTRADAEPGQVRWMRWSAGELVSDEVQALDYDGRQRPWFKGAARGDGRAVHWTEPYTFFTTKDPGITASIKWEEAGVTWVVALDVMLVDISAFTTSMKVGRTGKVMVLDEQGAMLGLPRTPDFDDRDSFRGHVLEPPSSLGRPELDAALAAFEARGWKSGMERVGEGWWADLRPVTLGNRTLYIASLVDEGDFAARANRVRNLIFGVTLIALFLAVGLALLADRALRIRIEREVKAAMKLGQYTLEDKLGAGGMGEVYRARHAMLRRPTAIKLLTGGDRTALGRFEREVQLTASLTHPNTIAVYDYGRTPEGLFYYAMEFVDGLDLDAVIALDGPQPAARVIHILRQVCGSLAEAHAAGLVHRDIKPGNVMLCARGGQHDVVKVLDFGLVTDLDERGSEVIGTPRYMAPEAIEAPDRVDGRSDVYAVGAIGIFLLAARHAVGGEDVDAICAAHLEGRVHSPTELGARGVPADLEQLLLRCMRRQPSERPSTVAELAARLAECADAGAWSESQAAAWWAEHAGRPTAVDRTWSTQTEKTFALTVNLEDRPRE